MGLSCGQENSVLFKSLTTLHYLSADPLAPKIESLVSTPRISLHVRLSAHIASFVFILGQTKCILKTKIETEDKYQSL